MSDRLKLIGQLQFIRDYECKTDDEIKTMCKAITLLSEEPERPTGRWIYDGYDHPHGIEWCHCSICGNRDSVGSVYTQVDVYPYCAKCGARMMEVENEC